MFCSKCGAEIKDDAKFCSKCGSPVGTVSNRDQKISAKQIASVLIAVIVVLAVILGVVLFLASRNGSADPEDTREPSETGEERNVDSRPEDGPADEADPSENAEVRPVLQDVTWEDTESENWEAVKLNFVFDDGTVATEEVDFYPSTVEKVEYMDITGDGVDETLVYRYFANTATEYTIIDFFQIGNGTVENISPGKTVAGLSDNVWNMTFTDTAAEGYTSPVLKLESYGKENAVTFLEDIMLLGYKDGSWQIKDPRLVRENHYDQNGVMDEWTEYDYDSEGKMLTETVYFGERQNHTQGDVQYKVEYTYDGSGRLTGEHRTSEDVNIHRYQYDYSYDEAGNLLRKVETDIDSGYTAVYEYELDSQGNQQYTCYEESGNVIFWSTNEYDEQGRLICEGIIYPEGYSGASSWSYEYDEQGYLISSFVSALERETIYKNDSQGNPLIEINYDIGDENVTDWKEYIYE